MDTRIPNKKHRNASKRVECNSENPIYIFYWCCFASLLHGNNFSRFNHLDSIQFCSLIHFFDWMNTIQYHCQWWAKEIFEKYFLWFLLISYKSSVYTVTVCVRSLPRALCIPLYLLCIVQLFILYSLWCEVHFDTIKVLLSLFYTTYIIFNNNVNTQKRLPNGDCYHFHIFCLATAWENLHPTRIGHYNNSIWLNWVDKYFVFRLASFFVSSSCS